MKRNIIMLGMALAATSEGGNGTPPPTPVAPSAPPTPAPTKTPEEIAIEKLQLQVQKEAELNADLSDLKEFVAMQELAGKQPSNGTLARISEIEKELDKLTLTKKYGAIQDQAKLDATKYSQLDTVAGSFKIVIEVGAKVEGKERTVAVSVTGARDKSTVKADGSPKPASTGESIAKGKGVTVDGTHYESASQAWTAMVASGVVDAQTAESNKTNSKVRSLESFAKKNPTVSIAFDEA